jgi:hypothetical protein
MSILDIYGLDAINVFLRYITKKQNKNMLSHGMTKTV